MTNTPDPRAEGDKQSETKDVSSVHRGAPPVILNTDGSRSKRKRAFHRALKRGEVWAQMQDVMIRMVKQMYAPFIVPEEVFPGVTSLNAFLAEEEKK